MDIRQFQANRERFPPEELARYSGQYVAWGPDGTRIVACNDDELRLAEMVKDAGYNSAEILIAFVPAADEILLGGGMEIAE